MIIKKYFHSCLVIEEANKRILIDPGNYSFMEGRLHTSDIGKIDAMIITHKHEDHFHIPSIRELLGISDFPIFANQEIVDELSVQGVQATALENNQEIHVSGFTIQAIDAPHERLPVAVPHNTAFCINRTFLHPGDSYAFIPPNNINTVALAITAPWATLNDTVRFAKKVGATNFIAIHDGYLIDYTRARLSKLLHDVLQNEHKDDW